jgi:hypothetical protein
LKVVDGKWAVIACGRRKKDEDQLIRLVYLYNTGKETIKCLRYLNLQFCIGILKSTEA